MDSLEVANIEFLNDVLVREQSIHEFGKYSSQFIYLESIQAKRVHVYRQMSQGSHSNGSVKDVQSGG